MNTRYKHTYMVITTTFELEPLLERYVSTYPNGDFRQYQIVFKSVGEWEDREGEYAYMVVMTPNESRTGDGVGIYDSIQSFCSLENQAAVAAAVNSVFPHHDLTNKTTQFRRFGNWSSAGEE